MDDGVQASTGTYDTPAPNRTGVGVLTFLSLWECAIFR